MRNIQLDGAWRLVFKNPLTGGQYRITAVVPGNIANDLARENIIPDPYVGSNSLLTYRWERTDFTYHTAFSAPEIGKNEKLELVFEGIDTAATIKLDGKKIAFVENMFIPHAIDITESVKNGRKTHELSVEIHNIMDYSAARVKKWGMSAFEFCHMPVQEAIYARKAQHMFGWDIAPRIVFGGIWRKAYLRVRAASEIVPEEFYFAVLNLDSGKKSAKVEFSWGLSFDPDAEWNGYSLVIKGACGNSKFETKMDLHFTHGKTVIDIQNAKLWWPAGYGEQNLYDITLVLQYKGKTVDTYKTRVGIRTVKLDINSDLKDTSNNRFAFYVNDVLIHAHGSNWVPVDALHSCDEKRIPRILKMWKDTNCNIIRCWGGGVYEDHRFFDICDEYGLMVWQDFMFGCSRYPQNDEFLSKVRNEADIIIRKLRNHPSLILWAGDNEIDATFEWRRPGSVLPSQNKISRVVLKEAVEFHDPFRPYLPSSPFIPDEMAQAKAFDRTPEQHLWGPRGYFKADFYAKNTAKFASEIGYHGMPAKKSMAKFLSKDKIWGSYNNEEWIVHAAGFTGKADGPMGQRNYLMLNQVKHLFGTSVDVENIDDFILASQITQAEAKKYFVEMFRAGKPDRTGIIWWNMIDCWPQFSDAIVDYYYEKKLAYDYLARAQLPVALMVSEESGSFEIVAVNDTLKEEKGPWTLTDISTGNVISSGNYLLEPNGKSILGNVTRSKSMQFLLLQWKYNGASQYNHYINGEAPWDFTAYRQAMSKFRLYSGKK